MSSNNHDNLKRATCAQNALEQPVTAGQVISWCACGLSAKRPFCDGSHRRLDSGIKSIKYVADCDTTIRLCGCLKTSTAPLCDGCDA